MFATFSTFFLSRDLKMPQDMPTAGHHFCSHNLLLYLLNLIIEPRSTAVQHCYTATTTTQFAAPKSIAGGFFLANCQPANLLHNWQASKTIADLDISLAICSCSISLWDARVSLVCGSLLFSLLIGRHRPIAWESTSKYWFRVQCCSASSCRHFQ